MRADLRGFAYPLDAVLERRQWELDALLIHLGRLQGEIQETLRDLEELRQRRSKRSAEVAAGMLNHVDPWRHRLALRWLAALQTAISNKESHLRDLESERAGVRADCLAQQQKVDVIRCHREEAVMEYTQDEGRRLASEADRDWVLGIKRRSSQKNGV